MRAVIFAAVAALGLSGCQKTDEPVAAEAPAPTGPTATAGDTLGTPPGLAGVTVSAADAIADFRNDAPIGNADRPVNWDETLERDATRRQMFYRAEQVDPSVVTAADRVALAELETILLEEICLNLPLSASASGYESVTPADCPAAAT